MRSKVIHATLVTATSALLTVAFLARITDAAIAEAGGRQ